MAFRNTPALFILKKVATTLKSHTPLAKFLFSFFQQTAMLLQKMVKILFFIVLDNNKKQ